MAKFINNVTSADESISRRLNDLETRLERKRLEKEAKKAAKANKN